MLHLKHTKKIVLPQPVIATLLPCALYPTYTRTCISFRLTISSTSLVAQLEKNLPSLQETWVRSLDWEDTLEKGEATHSSILAWRTPGL